MLEGITTALTSNPLGLRVHSAPNKVDALDNASSIWSLSRALLGYYSYEYVVLKHDIPPAGLQAAGGNANIIHFQEREVTIMTILILLTTAYVSVHIWTYIIFTAEERDTYSK